MVDPQTRPLAAPFPCPRAQVTPGSEDTQVVVVGDTHGHFLDVCQM